METKLSDVEQQFINKFQQGEVKVFILVTDPATESRPIITLIHRARFGSEILPIPAWLNRSKAEQFLQSRRGVLHKERVIEITHHTLEQMIEKHEYDASYFQAISYHLDLQADEAELKDILGLE